MLSLDELVPIIRANRLHITAVGTLWAPNTYVPMAIRRAIVYHRLELLRLMAEADVRICASPGLHRPYWHYRGLQRYSCDACAKIPVKT